MFSSGIKDVTPHPKCPKILQMRHFCRQNSSRLAVVDQKRDGLLLRRAAGEPEMGLSAPVRLDSRDRKTRRLSHPGQHGDIPLRAADRRMDGIQTRDDTLVPPEPDRQIPPGIAPHGEPLQNRLLLHRLPEDAQGLVLRELRAHALR